MERRSVINGRFHTIRRFSVAEMSRFLIVCNQ